MADLQKNRLKVTLFKDLLKVANWMALLPNRLTPPPFRLIQIGSAFWLSRALYVATTLGLADALGDDEKSTTELALSLELYEDHLYTGSSETRPCLITFGLRIPRTFVR